MRQVKKDIFKITIKLMSVYWAMYYFGELEEENRKNGKRVKSKNKKITAKVKIKKETKQSTGKEKKKEQQK